MAQRHFSGTVVVNGGERRLEIERSPLGHTVIQVDGVTIYDKKPFVNRNTLDFDIVPGKKAMLTFQQVSLKDVECDFSADGGTTTLTAVDRSGSVAKPVGAKQRQEFGVRTFGVGCLVGGVISLVGNYLQLKEGSYYPKFLFMAPMLLVGGVVMLANPRLDASTPGQKKATVALAVFMLIVSWFFEHWFVSTFGPQ